LLIFSITFKLTAPRISACMKIVE